MKYQLVINIERSDDTIPMDEVMRHTLEMVQIADRGGFAIVWAAAHHGLEMNVAPNPFQLLIWWANTTSEIQREFDRMQPGLKQPDAYKYMQEMLPALKALWAGDYEHNGEYWSFPTATSVPKPVQKPHPPLWIAARSPVTFDYAIANNCNIISWPLTRPFDEAELYKRQLDEAIAKAPGCKQQLFAMMRHTALYENKAGHDSAIRALQSSMGCFENLFRNFGDVVNGFPKQIPLDELVEREQYDPKMLEENLMFGSPDSAIEKLKRYEALGVDHFAYLASMNWSHKEQKRSLELFCQEVIPEFR